MTSQDAPTQQSMIIHLNVENLVEGHLVLHISPKYNFDFEFNIN